MAYTTRVNWETLRSVNSTTFTGVYVPVGGPLLFPSYLFKIVNNSTVLVTVSIDGATDIDVLPPGGVFLYDEQRDTLHESLPAGTQIFVKGAVGTGLVYVVSQYIIQS